MNISEALSSCVREVFLTHAITTARSYKFGLLTFESYLTNFFGKELLPTSPLENINMEHFINYPGWLLERGYTKNSIRVYMASSKCFMDWLVINGYLSPGYRETLRYDKAVKQVSKKKETKLPRFPAKGVVEKLLQAVRNMNEESPIRERNIALIELLASSGCRNSEAVQLNVKDINLKEHYAIVIGKGSKERKIFFNQSAADVLYQYWIERGHLEPSSPAFCRHDNGTGKKVQRLTPTTVRNIVNDVVVFTGLEKGTFTPHYFRHAFAINMLRETHDLAAVQDLLGHSSPVSTRVYAKIYPDDLREIYDKVYE